MGQHINRRPTPLDCRIKTASMDLHIIMKDLQRDCKPYWKFSELERELLDIADAVKQLGANHRREITVRRKLAAELKEIAADLKNQIGKDKFLTAEAEGFARGTKA